MSSFLKKIRKKIPNHEVIFKNRFLKPFAVYFNKPCYWAITRKNVSFSIAIGVFAGLMPWPIQMLTAFILSYIFKVNLAISMITTFYTNPLTHLPLYYLAFKIGCFILGIDKSDTKLLITGDFWIKDSFDWLMVHGKPLVLGVFVLGIILSLMSYILVRFIWSFILIYHKNKK